MDNLRNGGAVVRLDNGKVSFGQGAHTVQVLRGVSLSISSGEIVALVGESGSGKSTIARLIMRLYSPDEGRLYFHAEDVSRVQGRPLKRYRQSVQMVFQDPFASLNPAHSVATILKRSATAMGIRNHQPNVLRNLLKQVGLVPAQNFLGKYPHELSGGQRQRVAFARALAKQPELLIADEPVSMLDVSLRLGILNLMLELNEMFKMAILYITHDLASARYVAARIVVMYAGHVVEEGPATDVVDHPQHPYSKLLIQAAPDPSRRGSTEESLPSSRVSEPAQQGCAFQERCLEAQERCQQLDPPTIHIDTHRSVKCFLFDPD